MAYILDPPEVLAETATDEELEGWFLGALASSLPHNATPKLEERVRAIRYRRLVEEVARFSKCHDCDEPAVAVIVQPISPDYPYCTPHVWEQFKTADGRISWNYAAKTWYGQDRVRAVRAGKYIRRLCKPMRTDARGSYYTNCLVHSVGEKGVYVILAGGPSQGVTAPPLVVSRRAPDGLSPEQLNKWCSDEEYHLVGQVMAEARAATA